MGTIKKAQICWGKKSGCGFTCQDLHKRNVGGALKKDAWQSVINVNTGLKKMLACFTGQCSPLSGRDTYSVGSFFEGHGEAVFGPPIRSHADRRRTRPDPRQLSLPAHSGGLLHLRRRSHPYRRRPGGETARPLTEPVVDPRPVAQTRHKRRN